MTFSEFKKEVKEIATRNGLEADIVDYGDNIDGPGTRLCRRLILNIHNGNELVMYLVETLTDFNEEEDVPYKKIIAQVNDRYPTAA